MIGVSKEEPFQVNQEEQIPYHFRLLGELVHLPFKDLLSSKKSIMPKLSGNTTLLTPYVKSSTLIIRDAVGETLFELFRKQLQYLIFSSPDQLEIDMNWRSFNEECNSSPLFNDQPYLREPTSNHDHFSVAQLAIRSHIPVEFRDKWQLLFSSNQHGSSFSQMAQRVDGEVGRM